MKPPADVNTAITTMYEMRHDLPDVMLEPLQDLYTEYRICMRSWQAGGDEPGWNYFREAMNEMCRDEGMPLICEEPGN